MSKQIEASRQDSERLKAVLEIIIDTIPAFVAYLDTTGRYVFVNAAYEKWFGIPREKIVGKHLGEIAGQAAYQKSELMLKRALRGETVKYENLLKRSDGQLKWVEGEHVPDLGPDGKIRGCILLAHDITARKKAEGALRSSEALFRTLFEQAPFSVQLLLPTGQTLKVNRAWKELWNASDELIQNYILTSYNVLTDSQLEAKGILPYIKKGFEGEIMHVPPVLYDPAEIDKTGRSRWVEAYLYPVKDGTGTVEQIFLIHHDVTEQVAEREDQRLLSELYIQLTSASNIVEIVSLTTQTLAKYLKASRSWLSEINEFTARATVHKDYAADLPSLAGVYDLKIFGPELVASWRKGRIVSIADVRLDPRTSAHADQHMTLGIVSFITVPLHRDGKMIAALNVSAHTPREWTDRELDLTRLITENMWSAVEKIRLFQQAQEAIRVRDEFISICSHELKTPVTSLKLQFQMAERQSQKGDSSVYTKERTDKRIEIANRQLDRMSKLIDDMLDVSRVSSGNLQIQHESLNLVALCSEVLEHFHEQFRILNITFEFETTSKNIFIKGDRFRLEQVITNLLTNAIKYGAGNPVKLSLVSTSKLARLTVEDKGIGIAKESMERIFQRFERAVSSRNISGLGLGLYITKQIVDAHGGRIYGESDLGAGSRFTVELPLAE